MGKKVVGLVALLLVVPLARSAQPVQPAPKAASVEVWEAAYLDGARAGHYRTTFTPAEADGKAVTRSRQALDLTVRRFEATARVRMESGTDETEDGKVVGVYMKIDQAGKPLVLQGIVKDDKLHVEINNGTSRELEWNDKVLGLQAQERLFRKGKLRAGDKLEYQSYEPQFNTVVTARVAVGDEEDVEVSGKKVKLRKVVITSDKIEVADVQLPPMTLWLDGKGQILRRQLEIPGLGKIVLVRTTKEAALKAFEAAQITDVGLKSLVRLNRKVPRFNVTTSAVYRITIDGDADPKKALAEDARQKIASGDGRTLELHVTAVRKPPEEGKDDAAAEYLGSNHYLDHANARVTEFARKAVGDETDAWKKGLAVEGWVHRHMRVDATVPVAPAGQVAERLRGDCRQYAMLTAAMCRAAGVPSRTALGLVYGEDRAGKPILGFHMWCEVHVRGQWVGLDATLGEGGVGAAHIKISDHSWHKTQSLTPLLPLQKVLGKMKVEVVRVAYN